MAAIRRDGAHIQKLRIEQMSKDLRIELLKGEGETPLSRFQARCQFNYGLNWETTRRYLRTLEVMELCRVNDKENSILEYYDVEAEAPKSPETVLQKEVQAERV